MCRIWQAQTEKYSYLFNGDIDLSCLSNSHKADINLLHKEYQIFIDDISFYYRGLNDLNHLTVKAREGIGVNEVT